MSRDLNKIMEIMKLESLPEYEMQIQRMMYLQEHEEYMVSFMGQFSAGKSYLINNLIGKPVLPVHRSETTALITFVKYDQNERVEIIYKDGTNSEKGLEAVNELWESGNKEELEQIETLFVYVNADLLKNGLVLADTPGVNTLISEHEALTRETLQSSDKIVYVMGKAAAEEDLNFVKNIRMNGIQTIFVRTHMDCLNDTEEDPNKTIEEPFLQLSALEKLVSGIKNDMGLDIMIYTGYCLEELFQYFDEERVQNILVCTDLLVDGEYKEELDHGEMYRGSENQKIYSPSGKYQKEIETIEQSKNRDVEFDCSEGEIFMVGIPPKGFYQELLDRLIKANN